MHRLPALLLGTVVAWLLSVGCNDTNDHTDATTQAIDALCRRMGSCSNTTLSAAELSYCRQAAAPLATVLVDPEYFRACLGTLSCSDLQDQEKIGACSDLDPSTLTCDGDVLLGCTNGGLCQEIDCRSICPVVGATFDSCGTSPAYGYEVCICTQ